MGAEVVQDRRFRRWIGGRFGVDEAVSDRIARRITHCLGALLLIYYVLPAGVFVLVSKEEVLLAALAAAWIMEGARHVFKFDLPMIRPYEERRVASYAFYATALAGAVLLFPLPIAATVILGTSLVDPLAGELRLSHRFGGWYPLLPFVVYAALAVLGLSFLGGWDLRWAAPLAIVAAGIALAVEYPKIPWIDDDLAMTFVPAIALYVVGVIVLGLPG